MTKTWKVGDRLNHAYEGEAIIVSIKGKIGIIMLNNGCAYGPNLVDVYDLYHITRGEIASALGGEEFLRFFPEVQAAEPVSIKSGDVYVYKNGIQRALVVRRVFCKEYLTIDLDHHIVIGETPVMDSNDLSPEEIKSLFGDYYYWKKCTL